jgi:hypothetical protein
MGMNAAYDSLKWLYLRITAKMTPQELEIHG